jgi:hypothetical protein
LQSTKTWSVTGRIRLLTSPYLNTASGGTQTFIILTKITLIYVSIHFETRG